MPPQWALGFWHRTPSLATAKQVTDEVTEFGRRGFPLDVIGLEPGWESRSYPGSMEWSPERFPNPASFVGDLKKQGIRVNLWENPYVAPGTELHKQLGQQFGSHTVWLGSAPDIYGKSAAKTVAGWKRYAFTRMLTLCEICFRDGLVCAAVGGNASVPLLQPDRQDFARALGAKFGTDGCEKALQALREASLAARLYVRGDVIARHPLDGGR